MALFLVDQTGFFLIDSAGNYLVSGVIDGSEGDPGASGGSTEPRSAANHLITIDAVVDFGFGPGLRRQSGPRREVADYERRLREMN